MEREELGSYHAGRASESFPMADEAAAVVGPWNGGRVWEMLLRCEGDRRRCRGAAAAGSSMAPSRHAQKMQSDDAEAVWTMLALD